MIARHRLQSAAEDEKTIPARRWIWLKDTLSAMPAIMQNRSNSDYNPLFFTRWITHFCAPVFFQLTGTGACLALRKKSKCELSQFLFTRGLWLIALELTIFRLVLRVRRLPLDTLDRADRRWIRPWAGLRLDRPAAGNISPWCWVDRDCPVSDSPRDQRGRRSS